MMRCDVLIVGGGPAGSSCAWALRRAGLDVVVLDRARFPRDKVCAGWVTPGVFRSLALDPAEYGAAGLTIQEIRGFRTGTVGAARAIETRYDDVVSYAIRRCEFDTFLLRRSGACIADGTPLASLRREGGAWIANDGIRAPVVVGAGGHFCPVARHRRGVVPPGDLVVAREGEFRLADPGRCRTAEEVPELFFCRDLDGYGWCVRKGEYLNVGIGRRDARHFGAHVRAFASWLHETGRAPGPASAWSGWHGHAYRLASAHPAPPVDEGLLLVGDAAGLAYRESGEGIRPAVESGLLAARTIVEAGGRSGREDFQPYVEGLAAIRPAPAAAPPLPSWAVAAAGRLLLRSRAFTRHVVLNRWFLHSARGAA